MRCIACKKPNAYLTIHPLGWKLCHRCAGMAYRQEKNFVDRTDSLFGFDTQQTLGFLTMIERAPNLRQEMQIARHLTGNDYKAAIELINQKYHYKVEKQKRLADKGDKPAKLLLERLTKQDIKTSVKEIERSIGIMPLKSPQIYAPLQERA